jgi:hypothetical protein
MTHLTKKIEKEQAKRFAHHVKRKLAKTTEKERTEIMKQISDGTIAEPEKAIFHQAAAAQGGKAPRVVKGYDSGNGHWILIQYSSGAPASWVGQRQWVPNSLLTFMRRTPDSNRLKHLLIRLFS